jgi:ribosomal protein S18 acetylase RimI-like enzyme
MADIRPAALHDLPGAYRVCLRTGDSGRDATGRFRDPDLLGHVFVGPYIVGASDLARVVADDEGVAGYLLAAADTRRFEAWAEDQWYPALRARHPRRADGSADAEVIDLLHAPPHAPEAIVDAYPAHLHIDLLERVRGQGWGRRLIEGLLGDLRARRVPGVHLDVARDNPNAIAFYRHLGFEELEGAPDAVRMGRRLAAE